MFSFHKPRVYRSTEGCCICRAKSSSSRFTDSRKYESDSMKCFDLKYPRHGEICNACVLLVKRYKRLPVGSTRHWGHVVDARAGPGTKSMSKHKKSRDDSGEQRTTSNNTSNGSSSSSNTNSSNGISATSNGHSSRRTQNSKSLIPEKFSKIFKKSKKSKTVTTAAAGGKRELGVKRRSAAIANTTTWEQHSLPTTPDSLDSDYEDGGRNGLSASGAIVQFQTQTRASSYRSRNATIAATATVTGATNGDAGGGIGDGAAIHRRRPLLRGSKRRKLLVPRRNCRTMAAEQDVQFFDESEWQERKTCCGMVYECAALGGALLIDVAHYQPCAEHQQPPTNVLKTQQQVIATLPAVVQLSPPILPMAAATTTPLPLPLPPIVSTNSTPVLKKHHLFFKRQSECFPHGDLNLNSNKNNTSTNTQIKTESMAPATPNAITIVNSCSNSTTLTTSAITEAATVQPCSVNLGGAATPLLSISTTNISATAQMPRHSTAKITTISPPIAISGSSSSNNSSSACNKLMHKIKTGKIFKHSVEKFSAGVAERVKASSDGPELKNVVRAVHKSYVLTKPTTIASINGSANAIGGLNGSSHQQLTNATLHGVSPSSICTASSAPKFSDNSSDSGFDENMQERKSASPLQEDTERKLAARVSVGSVQTMFLANGVQIQGQTQNLMLTGNEVAAKMFQNRNQAIVAIANGSMGNKGSNLYHNTVTQQQQQQYQTQQNNHPLTAAPSGVKIAQIVGTVGSGNISASSSSATVTIGNGGGGLLGPHAKSSPATAAVAAARAIYNNNTIQHENGVTTIVPASSLAASTQTAAMNAMAPSTVTITPAPTHHLGVGVSNLNKKLTPASANVIASGNNPSNSIIHGAVASNNNHNLQTHHASALNQKIILVKTASATSKYNHNNNGNVSNAKATVTAPGPVSSAAIVSLGSLNASACKN